MGGGGGGPIRGPDTKKLEEKAKQSLKVQDASRTHVFVSFAYDDEGLVNLLRGQAKNEASQLDFDDFSLKTALNSDNEEYIKRKIRERIRRASVTAVYLSPYSANSKWVRWEIRESLKLGKGVIGLYEGSAPPLTLPAEFREYGLRVVKWSHKELMDAIADAKRDR